MIQPDQDNRSASTPSHNDYGEAFPNSEKAYRQIPTEDGETLCVPYRRVHLTDNSTPIDLYDTSGPLGTDVNEGLPKLREKWIDRREKRGRR